MRNRQINNWDDFILNVLEDVSQRLDDNLIRRSSRHNNLHGNRMAISIMCKVIRANGWVSLPLTLFAADSTSKALSFFTFFMAPATGNLFFLLSSHGLNFFMSAKVQKYRQIFEVLRDSAKDFRSDLAEVFDGNESEEMKQKRIKSIRMLCTHSIIGALVELNRNSSTSNN